MSNQGTNNISLNEIRDNLIRKKALYEDNQKKLEDTVESLRTKINSLKQTTIDGLADKGINVSFIKYADYDRLKTDSEYLQEFTLEVSKIISQIRDRLVNL